MTSCPDKYMVQDLSTIRSFLTSFLTGSPLQGDTRQHIQERFLTRQPHVEVQETAFNLKYEQPSFWALLLIHPNKQSEKVFIHSTQTKKTQNTPLYTTQCFKTPFYRCQNEEKRAVT